MPTTEDVLRSRVAELERINADQAQTIRGLQATLADRQNRREGPDVYVDGGCRPNPGRGAWAFVVVDKGREVYREIGGPFENSTNNKMEMSGVIAAMGWLRKQGYKNATIRSDSKLTLKVAAGKWQAKKNKDLAAALIAGQEGLSLRFRWIKGHDGNLWNDLVDRLCTETIGTGAAPTVPKNRDVELRRLLKSKADRPSHERRKRGERGTFGAASGVRHIDPTEYLSEQEGR